MRTQLMILYIICPYRLANMMIASNASLIFVKKGSYFGEVNL